MMQETNREAYHKVVESLCRRHCDTVFPTRCANGNITPRLTATEIHHDDLPHRKS